MNICSTELLPYKFDEIVELYLHKRLSHSARQEILSALFDSIRSAALRTLPQNENIQEEKSTSFYLSPLTIKTCDRFCNDYLSRIEIIDNIQKRSGLDTKMAHTSLLLIEAQIDIGLAVEEVITIKKFGSISLLESTRNESKENENWVQRAITFAFDKEFTCRKWKYWNLLSNTPHYLTKFVEALELFASFRDPHPFRIEFETLEQAKQMRQSKEEKIVWKGAFSEDELINIMKKDYGEQK